MEASSDENSSENSKEYSPSTYDFGGMFLRCTFINARVTSFILSYIYECRLLISELIFWRRLSKFYYCQSYAGCVILHFAMRLCLSTT